MKTTLDALKEIRERPGMYLGRLSLNRLSAFLDGCYFANGRIGQGPDPTFHGFRDWVVNRYNITSQHRWDSVILFIEHFDDERAYNKFFELLDLYLEEREKQTKPLQEPLE